MKCIYTVYKVHIQPNTYIYTFLIYLVFSFSPRHGTNCRRQDSGNSAESIRKSRAVGDCEHWGDVEGVFVQCLVLLVVGPNLASNFEVNALIPFHPCTRTTLSLVERQKTSARFFGCGVLRLLIRHGSFLDDEALDRV